MISNIQVVSEEHKDKISLLHSTTVTLWKKRKKMATDVWKKRKRMATDVWRAGLRASKT